MSRSRVLFFLLSSVLVIPMLMGTLVLAADRGRRPDPRAKDGKEVKEEDSFDTYLKYLAVFSDVVGLIHQTYVDDVSTDVLMAGALEGVTDALDPFSIYVPTSEVSAYTKAQATGMQLSGLELIKEHGATLVMAVEKGSPAETAGLKIGDLVAKLDGSATRTMPLWEMQEVLTGRPGTKVSLEVIRAGTPVQVSFQLASFNPPALRLEEVAEQAAGAEESSGKAGDKPGQTKPESEKSQADKPQTAAAAPPPSPPPGGPTVHLLRFHIFSASAVKQARDALAALSGAHVDKLLIDLRGASAGDADDAYQIARLFTTGGLGALKRRQQDVRSFTSSEPAAWQGRLVVLIDHGTAGPAEILATILRQKAGAELVGERTFGYAGRRSWADLASGGRLFFTDAFYAGPDGKPINESLKPDLQVDRTRTYLEKDVPLGVLILRRGIHRLLEGPETAKKAA
ncbi:MAG TPA: S41 family peptidase [Thermoanaerobaculia bacterium]|nr:S41 family peptidase [Thermoanaerobaculia bacterium]